MILHQQNSFSKKIKNKLIRKIVNYIIKYKLLFSNNKNNNLLHHILIIINNFNINMLDLGFLYLKLIRINNRKIILKKIITIIYKHKNKNKLN